MFSVTKDFPGRIWQGNDWRRTARLMAAQVGRDMMIKNFDEIQKMNKDGVDATMKSFGVFSKGLQALTTEVSEYSKKSFEEMTAATEKLFGAKSVETAIEIQTDYVKSAYEGFMTEASKMGDLVTELATQAYKPYESVIGKVAPGK
jgi:hypothetical protein